MQYVEGGMPLGDEITRKEFDGLAGRVGELEKTVAVADNELKHILADIQWIKKGVTWIVAIMASAVIGALLKLVLKV